MRASLRNCRYVQKHPAQALIFNPPPRCDLLQSTETRLSQRANSQALRRKQRFQMEVDNKSCYSSFCLRAGDTTFLSRVSLTHIVVVTVSNNKGPSPVQRREDYCLFEKGSFFSPLQWNRDMSLSQLISFLLVQI